MSTIFISHSSKDNVAAEELRRKLEQDAKHSCVFLDFDPTQGIEAGRSWERTLYRKLRACRVVIALCTDAYLQSEWCFAEIALARMEGKTIITLFCEGYTGTIQLPSILEEKQYIDLRRDKPEGYQRLWHRLDRMDVLGLSGDWDPRECPYPGLSPYEERHAAVFFGREAEIRAGLALLDRGAPGLIMVLGASGSGKSSFTRAGLLPRLRKQDDHWIVVDPFRPGHDPYGALAQTLAKRLRADTEEDAPTAVRAWRAALEAWTPAPPSGDAGPTVPDGIQKPSKETDKSTPEPPSPTAADSGLLRLVALLETLREEKRDNADPQLRSFLDWSLEDLRQICGVGTPSGRPPPATPLIDAAERLRETTARPDARVLLVIDQFEELLADSDRDGGVQALRFLRLLQASLEVPDTPLMVFVTMRSDFFDAFQQLNAKLEMDFETMSLGPLSVAGIQKAIEAPAQLGAVTLETGLVRQILDDAASPDALPLVAYMLWLLWQKCHEQGTLTVEAYQSLGGVVGALSTEAQAVLNRAQKLGKADALRRAFLQMVRLGEDGHYTREPAAWDSELLRPVHDQLDTLRRRRLLIPRIENGTEMVEVAHEALFRHWTSLRQWIDEERATFLLRQQLTAAANAWADGGRIPDDLWRGVRLAQAVDLWQSGGLDSDDARVRRARSFIKASEASRKRQLWRRRITVAGVLLLLSTFLGYALIEESEVTALQRDSWARDMAMQANSLLQTDPRQSVELAQRAVCVNQAFDGPVLPRAQLALNNAVNALQKERFLTGHQGPVTQARFLAGDSLRLVSVGHDRQMLLWALPDETAPDCAGVPAPRALGVGTRLIGTEATRPLLVTAAIGSGLSLYDAGDATRDPTLRLAIPSTAEATVLALSSGGDQLAFGTGQGQVTVVPISGSAEGRQLVAQGGPVAALAFSDGGQLLASAGWDGPVHLSDPDTGELIAALEGHREAVTTLTFTGDHLASGDWAGEIRLWQVPSGAQIFRLTHDAAVSALAVVPRADSAPALASASWDGTVRLWDVATGALLAKLEHGAPVAALAVTATPTLRLAAGTWDGSVHLWELEGAPLAATRRRTLTRHNAPVNDLTFSPDGELLASASDDRRIAISPLVERQHSYAWRNGMDVLPLDGARSWVAILKGAEVELRDSTSGMLHQRVVGFSGTVRNIAFSSDGTQKLGILADALYEYRLDPDDLMQCADLLTGQQSLPPEPAVTLEARCADFSYDADFRSILGTLRSLSDNLWRRAQAILGDGVPD
ncbi:TIR domain-containing protein [Loktanella agnita]|uniref:nSTAND1 domain-containing NTPase n=1 Tax=Loktanella agnita TaxID=287097 RepID=UPI003985B7CE